MAFNVNKGLISWLLNSFLLETKIIILTEARISMGRPKNSWQKNSNPPLVEYAPKSDSTWGNKLNRMFVKNSVPAINRTVAPKTDRLNFLALNVFTAENRPKTNAYDSKIIIDITT